ncbi:ABC transporter permease [uncultured Nisaea sp.]|uniref:ABC transporter permease n=1 Tax=uncultured Nisaea sp. TaxID=538215 RepID=UPI0030ECDA69
MTLPDWMLLLQWGDAGWGDEMVRGMLMTLAVAMAAFLLGIVIGTMGAALKLSRYMLLRFIGEAYTTLIRGVPDLLVIYLLFFGGSMAAMAVARVFGYEEYIEIDAFAIGTIALGTISGAYATEVIRGAVLAVPKGQIEAAKACGMSRFLLFRRIMVPQVARFALPGLGNVWQLTLKDTSLISIVGLVEIMRQASVASGSTQKPFTFYLTAGVLYLVLTAFSNKGFGLAELWANRGVRRA